MKELEKYENGIILAACIVLAFALFVTSCHKDQPEHLTASSLAGKKWECSVCANAQHTWEFSDNTEIAYQVYSFGQTPYQTNMYHFIAVQDTLHLFNLATKQIQRWTVNFESDSIANIHIQHSPIQYIQQLKLLK